MVGTVLLTKRRFLLLFVVAVALASTGYGFFVSSRPKGPQLDMRDGLLIDLGEGSQGELLEGQFRLGNSGTSELHFHLNAGCSCALLQPRDGVLLPGESLPVNVGLRLRNEGKDERVAIRIESNDVNSDSAPMWIVGKCPAMILADPCFLDLGHVPPGRSLCKEIRVQVPKLTALPQAAKLLAPNGILAPDG
jgi:hypothetical protein